MARTVSVAVERPEAQNARSLFVVVGEARQVDFQFSTPSHENAAAESKALFPVEDMLKQLESLSAILISSGLDREAAVMREVHQISTTPTAFGGLGLSAGHGTSSHDESELLFLVSAHLESLNSRERAQEPTAPLPARPDGRRGMTLSEKIFAAHDVDGRGEVKPGDIIRVDVDWILASELSWAGMKKTYDGLGQPGIFRNDRFWLAGDHVVDPRVMTEPRIEPLVKASDWAKKNFKMTENQGMNYTIMHTEFCRQRAQPGMLCIGSDSHTCSAGSLSALAVGMGVADVTIPLITGQTWFRVPESVKIEFVGRPKVGIGGKDVILYILKELKRNTVAADRIVEYTGPGLQHLSCDARFAIANMTTEFGGITGIFEPDSITKAFVNKRKIPKHKSSSVYYRPDADAEYAETHIIDLNQVEPFIAKYPKPDDVAPVTEEQGKELDGCFIGACTTTEEDLVLAALVLEEGLKRGLSPVKRGKRKVVPGSKPIIQNLRNWGLDEIYHRAGFEMGVPGCSYCVGMSADQAAPGERWLSSQNRNFKNRMGPGSFGSIASAVTVAASSFAMEITNPAPLLDAIDMSRVDLILGKQLALDDNHEQVVYTEPGPDGTNPSKLNTPSSKEPTSEEIATCGVPAKPAEPNAAADSSNIVSGKIQLLEDFIDTDALAPNEAISKPNITTEELGKYCLKHTHPNFYQRVNEQGHNIVVAGKAFGCGSSRENAVTALQAAGVKCVIARSFAFIYGRNQPNLGLLGFEMEDDKFWSLVEDGQDISVDLDKLMVTVGGRDGESFPFKLSMMQRRLFEVGGIAKAFGRWGKALWDSLTATTPRTAVAAKMSGPTVQSIEKKGSESKMEW